MKIALSGAGGNIGRILRRELPARGFTLRALSGRRPADPTKPAVPGEDLVAGDLRDPAVVDQLLQGTEMLVHMAGTSVERPLPEIIENNLVALHQVYEGALRHGLRRVLFASSNHAFGMHGVDALLDQQSSYRPDGFYGLSKMWGEGLARMYWDKHGLESVCLRIGSSEPAPVNRRHLSTWLGPADLVDLVEAALRAPEVGFAPVWGISHNDRAYYDLREPNALGWRPRQNAEAWAPAVQDRPAHPSPIAQAHQGGAFVVDGYTRKRTA